ncbi:hypothetical protein A5780_06350 [Nocardia sp. 852002-20019_SCH5090214]|uniref:hypothetical protein n=3 Tax=Nocardia africana TaxID=134964 RepID=UPI0007EA0B5F|nr:hypothetical protein [Nocardia africana]MCC3311368.1 hypothetical protein [Nocardia africana]OBA41755.1 hypothetical protein A5780_06350 [Nocardia sp. 852002-20019_SCH5090214]
MKVLAGVYAHASAAREMAAAARAGREATGELPPPSWSRAFRTEVLLGQELEKAGLAAGVPREWLNQARTRAHLGQPWRRDLHWRNPKPVDRTRLLVGLAAEAHRIQDLAAVAVAYEHRGAHAEPGTATWVMRNLRRSRTRLVQLARLLAVTDDEAQHMWNSPQHWTAAAESAGAASVDELDTRWRAHARSDQTSIVLQARALTKSGITAPTGAALPPPDQILDVLRKELVHNSIPAAEGADRHLEADVVASAGEGIELAVAATGIGSSGHHDLVPDLAPAPRQPSLGVEVEP